MNKNPEQQAESIVVEQTSTIDAKIHALMVKPGDLCEILATIPEDADIRCINIEAPERKAFSIVKIDFTSITTRENKPTSGITIKGMDMGE